MAKKKKKANPKRAGTKRRAAGWTLLTLGVIVAGVWVASGWFTLTLFGYGELSVINGEFDHYLGDPPRLRVSSREFRSGTVFDGVRETNIPVFDVKVGEWSAHLKRDLRPSWYNVLRFGDTRFGAHWTTLPLWPLPLLPFATGVPLLRLGILARRRALTGQCVKCGYSLAGLAKGAACPECGKGAGTRTK